MEATHRSNDDKIRFLDIGKTSSLLNSVEAISNRITTFLLSRPLSSKKQPVNILRDVGMLADARPI